MPPKGENMIRVRIEHGSVNRNNRRITYGSDITIIIIVIITHELISLLMQAHQECSCHFIQKKTKLSIAKRWSLSQSAMCSP